ncbi:hypothetical protein [Massilia sp. BJB1822]|uniref:hypothetical protein n=1 Tax=Massilia sp. BJB1822 TaxID=2744470 RepID=UPI0015934261|nr:hypothetical protein [Massilia sp. BJB1822]NVD98204.1 hypothetical protein [Massilia sp. BJB1822]
MKLFTICALSLALLSGCVGKSYEYHPEEGAPTATLRVGEGKPAFVYLTSEARCPKTSVEHNGNATTIPANTRLWVEAGASSLGLGYGRKCTIPLSFVAEPGKDYYILFQDNGGGCAATIVSRGEKGHFASEPSARREKAEQCPS